MKTTATDTPANAQNAMSPNMENALLLGQSSDWWDFWMIVSLVVVFVAGGLVAAMTTGSVMSHRRETASAKAELDRYKTSVKSEVALTHERTAILEKETAEAHLQYEKLKSAMAWREIPPGKIPALISFLATHKASVAVVFVANDPESMDFAGQIDAIFIHAGWHSRLSSRTFLGAASGISIGLKPYPSESDKQALSTVLTAFTSISLPFQSRSMPIALPQAGGMGRAEGAVKIVVGSRPRPVVP